MNGHSEVATYRDVPIPEAICAEWLGVLGAAFRLGVDASKDAAKRDKESDN